MIFCVIVTEKVNMEKCGLSLLSSDFISQQQRKYSVSNGTLVSILSMLLK